MSVYPGSILIYFFSVTKYKKQEKLAVIKTQWLLFVDITLKLYICNLFSLEISDSVLPPLLFAMNYFYLQEKFIMNGTPDEEVDYGSCGSSANPLTDSDHAWSTPENDSQD